MEVIVEVATYSHLNFVDEICATIAESAKVRGTGIARRSPSSIQDKIKAGKAIIATVSGEFAGFCYVESWLEGQFASNSALIVSPNFRRMGIAKKVKMAAFQLARDLYPTAKIFGITTSLPVMKINSDLGYRPVTFSELPQDESFWKGCESCPNYEVLKKHERKLCLCTGMLAPSKAEKPSLDLSHMIINPIKTV